MDINEIRQANLRTYLDAHGRLQTARKLGYPNSTFLSQMTSQSADARNRRKITEKTVRKFEEQLGLEPGTFDRPVGTPAASAPVAKAPAAPAVAKAPATAQTADRTLVSADLMSDILRTVGRVCADEKVTLATDKLADVAALGLMDAVEHNGVPREDRIRQFVRLLK